jgi:hypothetical protein
MQNNIWNINNNWTLTILIITYSIHWKQSTSSSSQNGTVHKEEKTMEMKLLTVHTGRLYGLRLKLGYIK